MTLKEMLTKNGVLKTFDKIGFGADKVLADLTPEAEEQYKKYEWIDGGMIVHAIPPKDMLKAGYPWEEWYNVEQDPFQHHILYLEKTDLCDMTYDCPADDMDHPEATRDLFWYLYNDKDARLLYAR